MTPELFLVIGGIAALVSIGWHIGDYVITVRECRREMKRMEKTEECVKEKFKVGFADMLKKVKR